MMASGAKWLFVDDQHAEAKTLVGLLSRDRAGISVEVMPPSQAKEMLLGKGYYPRGVLMDIDLSGDPAQRGSGAGFAQDVRVRQKARELPEFPVIRLAGRTPVKKHVAGDPTSDDLFDLRV